MALALPVLVQGGCIGVDALEHLAAFVLYALHVLLVNIPQDALEHQVEPA